MNGQPKNWKALVDSVSFANHPETDAIDRCILMCLAKSGSALGIGCRPGNAALMAAAGRRWSATHERLNKLERLGLIKCTEKIHGRPNTGFNPTTKASVFQILYRHPAYPDYSPNGRVCYLKKHPDGPDDSPIKHPVKPDDFVDDSAENIRSEAGKHPVTEAKTSGTDIENIRSIGRTSSSSQPKNIPTPTNGRGGVESLDQLPEAMQGQPFGKRKAELEKLISEYQAEVITKAVWRWAESRTPPIATYPSHRWWAFLDEATGHIKTIAREVAEEKRRNDPALKAADEKRQRDFETQAGGVLGTPEERRKAEELQRQRDAEPVVTNLRDLD